MTSRCPQVRVTIGAVPEGLDDFRKLSCIGILRQRNAVRAVAYHVSPGVDVRFS